MKKTQFKKIFIFTLFFILNLFLTNKIFAANLILTPSKESVGIGEQFYVDLSLESEDQSINAISGSISFSSEYVSFVRAEEGKSMVNLWVEKPKIKGNIITFAGVISNGFDGVIDPFDPSHKLPGLIIRLVFEASKSGQVDFSTLPFSLNLNDGLGTAIEIPSVHNSLKVENFTRKIKYKSDKNGTPELEAYVIQDPNIFNNKHALIFKATDKETGIKSVMIKEGRRDWKEIESPYLLLDQSRHSNITLQATSFSGAGVSINIDKVPYDWNSLIIILITAIMIIGLFILVRIKIYAKRK